ncbi:MAG TPA: hypothetical protein DEQ14_04335 [Treponema sp.]|nr:hypothetical protein [Treponema sp.]
MPAKEGGLFPRISLHTAAIFARPPYAPAASGLRYPPVIRLRFFRQQYADGCLETAPFSA